jgi:hypothetical protein
MPAMAGPEPHAPLDLDGIRRRTAALLAELPPGVELLLAAKTRAPEEVRAALEAAEAAGRPARVGHNYVQEAERMRAGLGRPAPWHLIGHLQRNKAKKAVELFDQLESLDSARLADALQAAAAAAGKTLDVLLEVNSAGEAQKDGALPADVPALARHVRERCPHLALQGLMTMGPLVDEAEALRPSFRLARELRDELRQRGLGTLPTLSMGMSGSFRVALEEGATRVRLGTLVFGPR